MYQISFYVPVTDAEAVKNAMFKAGAGKIGNYACCAWQVLGEGQFLPLEGSSPHLGKIHHLEKAPEYKVEMVCVEEAIQDVMVALRSTHPYEEPAFQIIRLEDF
jgi:structural hemagglutinin/hemolysin toxin protein RtxA